jgi:hypothetical protein
MRSILSRWLRARERRAIINFLGDSYRCHEIEPHDFLYLVNKANAH